MHSITRTDDNARRFPTLMDVERLAEGVSWANEVMFACDELSAHSAFAHAADYDLPIGGSFNVNPRQIVAVA